MKKQPQNRQSNLHNMSNTNAAHSKTNFPLCGSANYDNPDLKGAGLCSREELRRGGASRVVHYQFSTEWSYQSERCGNGGDMLCRQTTWYHLKGHPPVTRGERNPAMAAFYPACHTICFVVLFCGLYCR